VSESGTERAGVCVAMPSQISQGVEERDEWRERIIHALESLRGKGSPTLGRAAHDPSADAGDEDTR